VTFETDVRNSYFLAHIDIHPAFKSADVTQDVHQDVPQDVHQDVHQDVPQDVHQDNLDKWIEEQIRNNPNVTIKELGKMIGVNSKTIHRHITKLPHIKYVGSGYSGHWEVYDDVEH
jgi:ATP-dependent DNA helicase RecG